MARTGATMLAAFAAAMLAGGCETAGELGTKFGQALEDARIKTAEARANAPASLVGSELDGLYRKYPITNSQRPETWPRVAVTVTRATKGVFETQGIFGKATLMADDCVLLSLRVWRSANDGQTYDNLKLCAGELYPRLKGVPMYQVPTWGRRQAWAGEANTGSVRGTGPTPPASHFPTDAQLQTLWLDNLKNTIFFVGGVLHVLGFDWNEVADKRVWFVSAPTQA